MISFILEELQLVEHHYFTKKIVLLQSKYVLQAIKI